ncbi:hypothetical protein GCM10009642_33970 [Nocardiopsis metallicus]
MAVSGQVYRVWEPAIRGSACAEVWGGPSGGTVRGGLVHWREDHGSRPVHSVVTAWQVSDPDAGTGPVYVVAATGPKVYSTTDRNWTGKRRRGADPDDPAPDLPDGVGEIPERVRPSVPPHGRWGATLQGHSPKGFHLGNALLHVP